MTTCEPFQTIRGKYEWIIAPEKNLPADLHDQILRRYQQEWPMGFSGVNRDRKWLSLEHDNPIHIVLVDEDGHFASQAAFVSRVIKIGEDVYFACGINGLVTQPEHSWLAYRIIRYALMTLASQSGAPIFMGFCNNKLVKWYQRFGFQDLPFAKVRVDYRNPEESLFVDDEVLMVRALNDVGRKAVTQIKVGEELYFGSRPTW